MTMDIFGLLISNTKDSFIIIYLRAREAKLGQVTNSEESIGMGKKYQGSWTGEKAINNMNIKGISMNKEISKEKVKRI